jgi:hypothetical protein
MEHQKIEAPGGRHVRLFVGLALLLLIIAGARTAAGYVIEYCWWREMGQVPTWISLLLYSSVPVVIAALIAAVFFWAAHARGLKLAGVGLRGRSLYAKLTVAAALVLGAVVASSLIDNWTVVRYFGSRGLPAQAGGWADPVFGKTLAFYLFDVPFLRMLLRVVLAFSFVGALIYWLTARAWQLRGKFSEWQAQGEVSLSELGLTVGLESAFVRASAALFLVALAVHFYLGRFDMLYNDHVFLVGVDYVNEHVTLPLVWASIAACVLAAALVAMGRWKYALLVPAALAVESVAPRVVNALYVRPNEISIQKPYIQRHIEATRTAYGLNRRTKEIEFPGRPETRIDPAKHKALLDNVRLWDWRAFHDTVTQIQALRPYYVFADTDVDRYIIDGQLRQMLLAPRELDIRQVPDALSRWINPHFIYTHGYGMVMAEASRITPDGLPELLVKDAPAKVALSGLKLTRPEIYYGEATHEPVFVRTGQAEFNYPSGADNVHSQYDGKGGFPVSSFPMRVAAALSETDWNIILTSLLSGESRMMIRRKIVERTAALADFLSWDPDPYLVLTKEGRLVWMLDAYTVSNVYPYSREVRMEGFGAFNYIRNSVKATIDAYDGDIRLYIFEPDDPIIQSWAKIFPRLFLPADAMPADLRGHARFPETIFRAQAEIYRTYHMRDPEAFYNKEDLWDLARFVRGQEGKPEPQAPTYVVATLPDSDRPEFLLLTTFTPRNKENLIGVMVARCDGPNLGELVFLQLSKQALVFGPMQIEARINQDQNISKDLTLWNQQGSQVVRGQMLVLPVEDTFLYIEPIYIQASQARMPQLKKVAMAIGNTLIYTDTYEEAVAQLAGLSRSAAAPSAARAAAAPSAALQGGSEAEKRVESLRIHFQRYKDLMAQGKWAEAGKELEAVAAELARK